MGTAGSYFNGKANTLGTRKSIKEPPLLSLPFVTKMFALPKFYAWKYPNRLVCKSVGTPSQAIQTLWVFSVLNSLQSPDWPGIAFQAIFEFRLDWVVRELQAAILTV